MVYYIYTETIGKLIFTCNTIILNTNNEGEFLIYMPSGILSPFSNPESLNTGWILSYAYNSRFKNMRSSRTSFWKTSGCSFNLFPEPKDSLLPILILKRLPILLLS